MSARVHVDIRLEPAHGYDVIVHPGALHDLAAHVTAAAPAAAYAVITPDALADGIAARVLGVLHAAGLSAALLTFPDGEAHKTRETWAALTDRMLELRFGRDSCIIALGGGVTGDIAGFVAATYMRGVPFVQMPTTLLAMIDASVGGKTAVDTPAGKNLVGAFHSPRTVIIDPGVLRTLPDTELRSGLAEAVKHGAILDAGHFAWITDHVDDLLSREAGALEHLITRSVELKAGVVSEDPHETGVRAILNFGHTVGHGLERASGYGLAHGFAVAAGMCIEAALGEAAGVTRAGTSEALAQLLGRLGLPTHRRADTDELVHAMRIDKKARRGLPRFVLLREVGTCARDDRGAWTHEVDENVLKSVLRSAAAAPDSV